MLISPGIVGFVYLLGALALLALLREPLVHRDKPESRGFLVTLLATILFVLPEGLLYLAADYGPSLLPSEPVRSAIWLFRIHALATLSVGWLLLALGFVRRRSPSRRSVALLGGYLTLFGVVIGIDIVFPSAGLVLDRSASTISGGFLDSAVGPGFLVHTLVSYGCVLIATGLMANEAVRSNGLRRKQSAVLALASVPPTTMTTLHLFVVDTKYDLAAFGLTWAVPLISLGIYRMALLDISPVTRDIVMAEMDDAVITLDAENRVLDCNAAARDLFDAGGEECLGTSAAEFFSPLPAETLERFASVDDVETELTVPIDGDRRNFSLSISPVREGQQIKGRVIVLRDITPIKRREQTLKKRETDLDLLRQVFSRVLRHNIRTELTVIKGTGEQIATDTDPPHNELAELVVDASDDLLTISRKARQIEQLVDEKSDSVEYDLRELAERTIDDVSREHPEATIELTAKETFRVRCTVGLDAAIRNLVENAAKHGSRTTPDETREAPEPAIASGSSVATASPTATGHADRADRADPDVRIDIAASDGCPRIIISDDGPGIEPEELAVLEEAAETQLRHGSGIGLWLVKWVVDRSPADLTFETGADGTDVTIEFRESAIVRSSN